MRSTIHLVKVLQIYKVFDQQRNKCNPIQITITPDIFKVRMSPLWEGSLLYQTFHQQAYPEAQLKVLHSASIDKSPAANAELSDSPCPLEL